MQEIRIGANESGQRLDKFLRRFLPGAGSGFIYRMLRKKNILLDSHKAAGNEILQEGSLIRIYFSEDTIRSFQKENNGETQYGNLSLSEKHILYEDDILLLVNKPPGMLTQKADKNDVSLTELTRSYLIRSGKRDKGDRLLYEPGPVNRIDRNTSGIVAVPLTLACARQMSDLFRKRTIEKRYLALVAGEIKKYMELRAWYRRDAGTRKTMITREMHPGAVPVETHCRPLYSGRGRTLLDIVLVTGKTHQIRSHLQTCGFPVIGDPKYGNLPGIIVSDHSGNRDNRPLSGLRRQFLHSWQLKFPVCEGVLERYSGKCFTASLPEDLLMELKASSIPIPMPSGMRTANTASVGSTEKEIF